MYIKKEDLKPGDIIKFQHVKCSYYIIKWDPENKVKYLTLKIRDNEQFYFTNDEYKFQLSEMSKIELLQGIEEEFNNIIHCGKALPTTFVKFLYQKETQMKQNKLRWEDIPQGAIVKFNYSSDRNWCYYIKKNNDNVSKYKYISTYDLNDRSNNVSSVPYDFNKSLMKDLEIVKDGEIWFEQCFKAKKVIPYYETSSQILQNKLVNIFKFN